MPDTVPAMLEPGEFVIRKDAAEKIGMDKLNMLNNADRLESGHSAIDELIALSTLSGSQANGEWWQCKEDASVWLHARWWYGLY